jgi:hypothetical protein
MHNEIERGNQVFIGEKGIRGDKLNGCLHGDVEAA